MVYHSVARMLAGLSLVGVSILNMSCDAPTATVPRQNVQPDQLQDFPLTDNQHPTFEYNVGGGGLQFLLWPDGITQEKTSRVFDISHLLDQLNAGRINLKSQIKLTESDPKYQSDLNDQKSKITKMQQQLGIKKLPLSLAQANLNSKNAKLQSTQADLAVEQAKPNPDVAKVTADQTLINTLNQQIADLVNNQIPKFQAVVDQYQAQLDALNQQLAVLQKPTLDLHQQDDSLVSQGESLTKEVMTLATWFDMTNSELTIKLKEDGTLKVTISNWEVLPGQKRFFTTEAEPGLKPTIQNVTYTSHGGFFDFDVLVYQDEKSQTQLANTYSFHIGRNTSSSCTGNLCYQGDLNKKTILSDGTVQVQNGIAKLVDMGS